MTMQKKVVVVVAVAILAVSLLAGFVFTESPQASQQQQTVMQNIIIRPDGSFTPADAPIARNGEVYTFTDNIYGTVKIQKSNIILDGAGYTLSGPYNGSQVNVWVVGNGPNQSPDLVAEYIIGVDLGGKTVEGITIQNLNVKNFSIGMYMWTKNNTVTHCAVSESILGIMLSGSNTTVTNNYLAYNKQGLFFGFNGENELIPLDVHISHNGFVENEVQINGCFCEDYPENEEPHAWDNGREGNYWSDYNGTDADKDGIGDTAYVVDVQNQDRYPLMTNPAQIPTPTTQATQALPMQWLTFIAGAALVAVVTFVLVRRFNKPQ
ncbi:MAG: hypothetical protein NWE96_02870 [Candidatus Bathyarchaeota archaeon]|nr:hypothetical protein [Candidatus Bathyarchaeota archaeon]